MLTAQQCSLTFGLTYFLAPYLSMCPLLRPTEIPVCDSVKCMIHTTGRWRHHRSQGGCLAQIRNDLDRTMVTPLKTERELLCLGKPSCVNLFELYSPSCMHSCLLSAIQKETICNNFSISRNCAAPGYPGRQKWTVKWISQCASVVQVNWIEGISFCLRLITFERNELYCPHTGIASVKTLHLWPEERGGQGLAVVHGRKRTSCVKNLREKEAALAGLARLGFPPASINLPQLADARRD